jgi:hypothetical protein
MSISHGGYRFPSATGAGAGMMAPSASSPSSSAAPRVICPGAEAPPPRLDDHVVALGTPEEMIGGERLLALLCEPAHGDAHAWLTLALGVVMQPGYVCSVDMLTRYATDDDFAADLTIRRGGQDPETGQRYLEEVAIEVGNTQRLPRLKEKASRMVRRGVRQVFAVLVQEGEVHRWDPTAQELVRLGEGESLSDPPTLTRALPVPLVLLIARGAVGLATAMEVRQALDNFVAEALDAQGNPVLRRVEQRGEQRAMAQAILLALDARGILLDDLSRRRILACQEMATLQRWMVRAATASRIEDVLS